MRFISYSILAMLCLALSCGKKRLFADVSYSGTVFVKYNTAITVPNVTVTLHACSRGSDSNICDDSQIIIGTAVSDANGHFTIKGKAARSDLYFVSTKAPNGAEDDGWEGTNAKLLNTDDNFTKLFVNP